MLQPMKLLLSLTMMTSIAMLSACQSTGADGKPLSAQEIAEKRQATLKMSKVGLDALIKQKPELQKEIEETNQWFDHMSHSKIRPKDWEQQWSDKTDEINDLRTKLYKLTSSTTTNKEDKNGVPKHPFLNGVT